MRFAQLGVNLPRLAYNQAEMLERTLTFAPATDPAASTTPFAVDPTIEALAVQAGVQVMAQLFEVDEPRQWPAQVRLLRLIEAEQAPVVARLRREAKARGEKYKYWCVVSLEDWLSDYGDEDDDEGDDDA